VYKVGSVYQSQLVSRFGVFSIDREMLFDFSRAIGETSQKPPSAVHIGFGTGF
jgi:hypothetical protein